MLINTDHRLSKNWTVRGSNSDGGKILRTQPDLPWGPPSRIYNGYRIIPGRAGGGGGVRRPVLGVNLQPPSSADVKERGELYNHNSDLDSAWMNLCQFTDSVSD